MKYFKVPEFIQVRFSARPWALQSSPIMPRGGGAIIIAPALASGGGSGVALTMADGSCLSGRRPRTEFPMPPRTTAGEAL